VLNAIALAEGIEVSDDEIREQLEAGLEDTNENRRLIRDSMRRPAVKERFAASLRRERAIRMLLETVGGVDFAALEAEAAETRAKAEAEAAGELVDPVEDAVLDVETEAQLEEIDEMLPVVEAAVEQIAEAEGISVEEAAATLVGTAAAQLEAELAEAAADEPAVAADGEKPRQAPGDTSA
jgi:hypothetical protein